ncbi:MAG: CoA transferase [Chloroflexi bacterium]|nr:CoA transferase [Chloroflexota bacterium]
MGPGESGGPAGRADGRGAGVGAAHRGQSAPRRAQHQGGRPPLSRNVARRGDAPHQPSVPAEPRDGGRQGSESRSVGEAQAGIQREIAVGSSSVESDQRVSSTGSGRSIDLRGDGVVHALDGIKVVDLAINYAGPTSATYLVDQGADVIKVERRIVGDTSRRAGNTPFLKLNSYAFMAINRGKRSITLDITKTAGQEIVRDLIRGADVLVENFRPGVMERLGIGYDTLSNVNPRLVYGSLTAFGAKGPYADKAGFDRLAQGLAGAMYRKDTEGRPLPNGIWVSDWGAPMLMAFGIMAALFARERTGRGQRVESSLMQAAMAMQFSQLTVVEDNPTPPREENPAGYNSYRCSDGVYLNIGVYMPHQFSNLCRALDLPHLAADPRITDPLRRHELDAEVNTIITALLETQPSQAWLDVLVEADVPCAPIVDRAQVPYEEQVLANEMMVTVDHPVVGRTHIVGTPVRLSETPSVPLRPAPTLGEHTDEILGELGYARERIADLREAEVI